MAHIERSVVIDKHVGEVFAYVVDFDRHPEWQPEIESVHQGEGKIHVGSMLSIRRRLRALFAQLDLNADVVDYRINKRIEYTGSIGTYPMTESYTFDSQGRSTKVTKTTDIKFWILQRLFIAIFINRTLTTHAEKSLSNLKHVIETGQYR